MKSIASVGKMSCTDVLAGGDYIFHSLGYHRTEGDCESVSRLIEEAVCFRSNMQVDRIATYTDAVGEFTFLCVANVLGGNGELCLDSSGLSDIGSHGQTVLCTEILGSESEVRITLTTVGTGCLGLEPVNEAERILLCTVIIKSRIGCVEEVTKEEIVLGPVNESYVIGLATVGEILGGHDTSVLEEGEILLSILSELAGEHSKLLRLAGRGVRSVHRVELVCSVIGSVKLRELIV